MTKFGLNGFLERTKGASLRYKLREFWWQLRYAWQRAWRGYDFTDVFELGYNFTAKMPVLLAEFLKNNVGLFYPLFHFLPVQRQDKQNPLKTWLMPYKLILHPYPLPLFMVII